MAFDSLIRHVRSRSEPSALSSFSLINLIKREDWKLASMECHQNPREVRQWTHQEGFFDGVHASKVLPIHQACALCPPVSMIELLYEIYPEGASALETTFQRTPLHIACQTNASLEAVQMLLEVNASAARAKDSLGRLPLHYACSHGASPEVVEALLESFGGSAACADMHGWIPLHVACRFGDDDGVIRQLVEAFPASLRVTTDKGNTPLMCARKVTDRKHDHIVELLVSMMAESEENDSPRVDKKDL